MYTFPMRKYVIVILLVFFLLVSFVVAYGFFESNTFLIRSRAYVEEVSGPNSFAVSTPSCAKADGQEITRMYIYCLSNQGLPVQNVAVRLDPIENYTTAEFRPIQAVTDSTGKALFDNLSGEAGTKKVDVYCGDVRIKQAYPICFE